MSAAQAEPDVEPTPRSTWWKARGLWSMGLAVVVLVLVAAGVGAIADQPRDPPWTALWFANFIVVGVAFFGFVVGLAGLAEPGLRKIPAALGTTLNGVLLFALGLVVLVGVF